MAIGDTGQVVTLYNTNYIVLGTAGGSLVYAIKQDDTFPALCYVIDLSELTE